MAKIKAKVRDVRLIVDVKLSRDEEVIKPELNYLSEQGIRGFLRPNFKKGIFSRKVQYDGPMGVSLEEFFKNEISKNNFLFLIAQIVDAERKLTMNNLNLNNLMLNLDSVFVNTTTKELQFIYLPLAYQKNATDVLAFIHLLVYSLKPFQGENSDYIARFNMFLNDLNYYDGNLINQFINQEEPSILKTICKNAIGGNSFGANDYGANNFNDREDDDATDLLIEEDDGATDLLIEPNSEFSSYSSSPDNYSMGHNPFSQADQDFSAQPYQNYSNPNYAKQNYGNQAYGNQNYTNQAMGNQAMGNQGIDDDEYEGTTLLSQTAMADYDSGPEYPKFVRTSTNEVLSIDKPVFRLGKEKSYSDYFISDNVAISRSHADIISRDGQYYITDLNSKNFTFLNDEKLVPNQEIRLKDGDKIRLADEEFVFLYS